jgi:hypothetical protein
MRRLRAVMSVLAWTGTGGCALVLIVWFGSGWYSAGWVNSEGWAAYFLDGGLVSAYWYRPLARSRRVADAIWGLRRDEKKDGTAPTLRGRIYDACCTDYEYNKGRLVFTRSHPVRFGLAHRWYRTSRLATLQKLVCPLWLVFLWTALPTMLVWLVRPRLRFPPGHCQRCGYDLTGNVSGRCPECGIHTTKRPA